MKLSNLDADTLSRLARNEDENFVPAGRRLHDPASQSGELEAITIVRSDKVGPGLTNTLHLQATERKKAVA